MHLPQRVNDLVEKHVNSLFATLLPRVRDGRCTSITELSLWQGLSAGMIR
jgi:hypothetical protein